MRGGEIIELISDLGGGKTTFTRGLAQGLGSKDIVNSPSFTLINEYHARGLTMYHFDFYRLSEPGIMKNELAELIGDPKAIIVVEWADIVEDVLPSEKLTVTLRAVGATSRNLVFNYPQNLKYLMQDKT